MVALAMAIVPGISMAATLHVGPTQTYTTITSAVNAAGTGDIIQVDAGTYNEAVTVGKPLTLQASSGTKPLITSWPSSTYYGITINAPGVVVNGFKIVGAGANHGCIQVNGVANTRIENVDLSNGEYGINVQSSPNTTIASCTVAGCSYSSDTGGIFFQNSDKGSVVDSTVTGGKTGIRFWNSPHGVITNCTVSDATENGIYLYPTSYNSAISDCTVTNTTSGITIVNTNGVSISGCYMNCNGKTYGIYIDTSVNDNIEECSIKGATENIHLASVGYSHIIDMESKNALSTGLAMTNCNNIEISGKGPNAGFDNDATYGIYDHGGSNIIINHTQVTHDGIGIYFEGTTNSLITRSMIEFNNGYSVSLSGTTGISIYQNGIGSSGPREVLSNQATGTLWYTASPVTYTVITTDNNGTVYVDTHTNFTGNYWDAFHTNDSENDHISDHPYVLNGTGASNQTVIDNYPLLFNPGQENSSYMSVSFSGPAIPVVTPTATPVPSPFPSPSPWPSPSPSASASPSPSHVCSPSACPSSSGGSGGSGGIGGSSGGIWINGATPTPTPTPSASTNATVTPGAVTPTPIASASPTALPETPTPSATPSPTGGSATLYIVLAILAVLAIAGIAAYFLTRKK